MQQEQRLHGMPGQQMGEVHAMRCQSISMPCHARSTHQVREVLNLGDLIVVELQLDEIVQSIQVVNNRNASEAVCQALHVPEGNGFFLVVRVVGVSSQDLSI